MSPFTFHPTINTRAPGIHLVVTARERYTRASSRVLLSRISRMTMCFVIRSTSVKKYCTLLRPFTLPEKCDFTYLHGKYVKCSETVRQAETTFRTVNTIDFLVQKTARPVLLRFEVSWGTELRSQSNRQNTHEEARPPIDFAEDLTW